MSEQSEPESPPGAFSGIRVTRLAPSPTGALHLGNARTFLVNWALARSNGWAIALRVEDLDTPRVKPGAIEQALDDLAWLGMDWDGGALVQGADLGPYRDAMRDLAHKGLVYPCELSRADIEAAASAPQDGSHEVAFPRGLRPEIHPRAFDDEATNWRFVCPDEPVRLRERFARTREVYPARTVGDFVVWTKRGQPAYQLACVIDDARRGVTDVVRGDDLLDSAGRQLLLARALGLGYDPDWWHLPLVVGADGRRLAKRHGDTRLAEYRESGVAPERVIGLLAEWCGIGPREPMTAAEFRGRLEITRMAHEPAVFGPEDDAWLRDGSS